jgi:uncharacterized membrane protein YdjX (TVP38/TMEM64 family)
MEKERWEIGMSISSMEAKNTDEKLVVIQQDSGSSGPAKQQTWLARHWQKLAALSLWAVLLAAYAAYARANDLGPLAAGRAIIDIVQSSAFGPLIYILLYALRPLIFFSALVLTLVGGFLFGPVWGIVFVIIGANLSAMVAYIVGRYFGQGLLEDEESSGILQRYANGMRNNSFETIMIMRFIFLPYDLVNYMGGLLRIDWKAFLLATALGSIPGTIAFVLAGASLDWSAGGGLPTVKPWVLAMSALVFIISIALSRIFKRREQIRKPDPASD